MTHYYYRPIYGNYTHVHGYTNHGGIFTSSGETGRLKDNKELIFGMLSTYYH